MSAPGPVRGGRGPAVCCRGREPSLYVGVCVTHATSDVPTAKAADAGTLDVMTADSAAPIAAPRDLVRTGGPKDDSTWLEHVLGWTLVVVVAMFVTQVGWL